LMSGIRRAFKADIISVLECRRHDWSRGFFQMKQPSNLSLSTTQSTSMANAVLLVFDGSIDLLRADDEKAVPNQYCCAVPGNRDSTGDRGAPRAAWPQLATITRSGFF